MILEVPRMRLRMLFMLMAMLLVTRDQHIVTHTAAVYIPKSTGARSLPGIGKSFLELQAESMLQFKKHIQEASMRANSSWHGEDDTTTSPPTSSPSLSSSSPLHPTSSDIHTLAEAPSFSLLDIETTLHDAVEGFCGPFFGAITNQNLRFCVSADPGNKRAGCSDLRRPPSPPPPPSSSAARLNSILRASKTQPDSDDENESDSDEESGSEGTWHHDIRSAVLDASRQAEAIYDTMMADATELVLEGWTKDMQDLVLGLKKHASESRHSSSSSSSAPLSSPVEDWELTAKILVCSVHFRAVAPQNLPTAVGRSTDSNTNSNADMDTTASNTEKRQGQPDQSDNVNRAFLAPCRPVQYQMPADVVSLPIFKSAFPFERVDFFHRFQSDTHLFDGGDKGKGKGKGKDKDTDKDTDTDADADTSTDTDRGPSCYSYSLPLSTSYAVLMGGTPGALTPDAEPFSFSASQLGVCYVYKFLRLNGFPASNIVTISYSDTIDYVHEATGEIPSLVYKGPNDDPDAPLYQALKPALCDDMQIDYSGKFVRVQSVLENVLRGNEIDCGNLRARHAGTVGRNDRCSGRTLESTQRDHVFMLYTGHGFELDITVTKLAGLYFGSTTGITVANAAFKARKGIWGKASIFDTLRHMKFSKLVFYVDSCHAGAMFDSESDETFLREHNVFVITATDASETGYVDHDYTASVSAKFPPKPTAASSSSTGGFGLFMKLPEPKVQTRKVSSRRMSLASTFVAHFIEESMRANPLALTFRDHFDHMKRRKPLYPQFLAQFAGKMQSKSFYKRFVGNVHMYGSQSFLDMPISEFVTFPRWSSWLSADYRMINEVKFSICKKTVTGTDLPEGWIEKLHRETEVELVKLRKQRHLAPESSSSVDSQMEDLLTRKRISDETNEDVWKFYEEWVKNDITKSIGGARLLDVCMASGLQKPAQQCRCLGYQEDYPKQAFDYSTLGQDSAQARLNPLVFQHPKLDLDGDVQLFISTLEVPCFNSEQLQREGDLCLRLRAKKQSANFCFEISPEGKLVIDPKNAMIKFTAPGYTRYVEFSLYRRQGKTDYARRLGNAIRSSFMGEPDIVGKHNGDHDLARGFLMVSKECHMQNAFDIEADLKLSQEEERLTDADAGQRSREEDSLQTAPRPLSEPLSDSSGRGDDQTETTPMTDINDASEMESLHPSKLKRSVRRIKTSTARLHRDTVVDVESSNLPTLDLSHLKPDKDSINNEEDDEDTPKTARSHDSFHSVNEGTDDDWNGEQARSEQGKQGKDSGSVGNSLAFIALNASSDHTGTGDNTALRAMSSSIISGINHVKSQRSLLESRSTVNTHIPTPPSTPKRESPPPPSEIPLVSNVYAPSADLPLYDAKDTIVGTAAAAKHRSVNCPFGVKAKAAPHHNNLRRGVADEFKVLFNYVADPEFLHRVLGVPVSSSIGERTDIVKPMLMLTGSCFYETKYVHAYKEKQVDSVTEGTWKDVSSEKAGV